MCQNQGRLPVRFAKSNWIGREKREGSPTNSSPDCRQTRSKPHVPPGRSLASLRFPPGASQLKDQVLRLLGHDLAYIRAVQSANNHILRALLLFGALVFHIEFERARAFWFSLNSLSILVSVPSR